MAAAVAQKERRNSSTVYGERMLKYDRVPEHTVWQPSTLEPRYAYSNIEPTFADDRRVAMYNTFVHTYLRRYVYICPSTI